MNSSKTWLVYCIAVVLCFLMPRCDCQDYAQVECLRDSECEPCSICFDRHCEENLEICWDQVDNDCDGETDEGCDDVCDGVECYNPPPRECLDAITLRYFLSPGRCIEGSCDYESTDVVCESGCEDDHCVEDLCIGLSCNDFNPCTDDSCDPGSGCDNVPNSLPCEDGNQCTVFDVCEDSLCRSGAPRDCDDGIECTQDHCDVIEGCVNIPDDTKCDDDDICTDDTCDVASGCFNAYNTDSCDDGDSCTMNDSCSQGNCRGVPLDADGDGFISDQCGGDDCDDSDALVNLDAPEICNGKDNNCDGLVDMVGVDLCNYEAICQEGYLVYCNVEQGPVDSPSVLDQNTVWCAENSPILLNDDVVVLQGVVHTVGPCVDIRAADGVFFNVRGNLEVRAFETNPAVFTSNSASPVRGSWGGIKIQNAQGGKASLRGIVVEYSTYGLSVECCDSGGPVFIDRSIFHNNEMAFSGYALMEPEIEVINSSITSNTCGAGDGFRVFRNCVFSGNDEAICAGLESGNYSLYDCTITGNSTGISGDRGTVENCLISDNTEVGIKSYFHGLTITSSTITNNRIGIIFGDQNYPIIEIAPVKQNTICNNGEYDIKLEAQVNVDATNNWWCTTDPAEISLRIWDVYDDSNLGQVIFEPFLTEEP